MCVLAKIKSQPLPNPARPDSPYPAEHSFDVINVENVLSQFKNDKALLIQDRMAEELYSQGRTIEDIAKCLKGVPLHQKTAAAIKSAHARGCDLKVVSDANKFYIETILTNHGLLGCFSDIITNPAVVDEQGKLRIYPYNDVTSFHGCNLCPRNMCKGVVIKRFQASMAECKETRFIYLGDGNGDFCPILKLGKGDHVMPRKNFPLWDRIISNSELIEAEVHGWSNGEELEQILLQLIDTISNDGKS